MAKRTSKRFSTKNVVCPVCEEEIIDSTQMSIQCDTCMSWLHRRCAGLSKSNFERVSKPSTPFHCSPCRLHRQEIEIASLKDALSSLEGRLNLVERQVHAATEGVRRSKCASADPVAQAGEVLVPDNKSYAAVASGNVVLGESKVVVPDYDRRFNVVLYGLREPEQGYRSKRQESDLSEIASVLDSFETSVTELSVRDHFRLGKFDKDSKRPRPILIKFTRTSDVMKILAKSGSIASPLAIKPDLPPAERAIKSLLMKERWKLIQSGVDRKDMRIQGPRLMVKRDLYAQVSRGKLELVGHSNQTSDCTLNGRSDEPSSKSQSNTRSPMQVDATASSSVCQGQQNMVRGVGVSDSELSVSNVSDPGVSGPVNPDQLL